MSTSQSYLRSERKRTTHRSASSLPGKETGSQSGNTNDSSDSDMVLGLSPEPGWADLVEDADEEMRDGA
ncbi:MAG: hypothetical protein AAF456_23635, partial [Planctomycetota bacterium]